MPTKVINPVEKQIQEQQIGNLQGEAYIAKANHAPTLQKAKDVISPFAEQTEQASIKKMLSSSTFWTPNTNQKPNLNSPTTPFSGLSQKQEDETSDLCLAAIIGEVLALQAKSNSNYWSSLWKSATQDMMTQVALATPIASAIKASYTAQSNATYAQAHQSGEDGIINLTMAGGALAMGAYQEYTDPAAPDQVDSLVNDETSSEESNQRGNMEPIEDDPTQNLQNDIEDTEQTIEEENKGFKSVKRLGKYLSDNSGTATKRLTGLMQKGLQASMSMSMLSQGFTGLIVDKKYQTIQAQQQGIEGQAQALSKECEQFAQFYGQAFSRSEDLRQGFQQNIDYAMNILKSDIDALTQSTVAMFRG